MVKLRLSKTASGARKNEPERRRRVHYTRSDRAAQAFFGKTVESPSTRTFGNESAKKRRKETFALTDAVEGVALGF